MEIRYYDTWDEVGKAIRGKVDLITINNVMRIQRDFDLDLCDAFSKGQLLSKSWLVEMLLEYFPAEKLNLIVCGGWYGTLSSILFSNLYHMPTITSIDIDPNCAEVANALNAERWAMGVFDAHTEDMYHADYSTYDLVINTSCEHIPNMSTWLAGIPSGTYLLLQSNNFYGGAGHINCVESGYDIAPGMNIIDMAELVLPDYKRFMVLCQTP